MTKKASEEIREYIIDSVFDLIPNLVSKTAAKYSISRQAVLYHLNKMIKDGIVESKGVGKGTKYFIKEHLLAQKTYDLSTDLSENDIYHELLEKIIEPLPKNVYFNCQYGFQEMVNNAIDHSNGSSMTINITLSEKSIKMSIYDDGVGIFKKIKKECNLVDERHAILELSKGKLTTDPENHTGQGIFFTSQIVDRFAILSGELTFLYHAEGDDWLLENEDVDDRGTLIRMNVFRDTNIRDKDIFDKYSSLENEYSFDTTHVPIKLLKFGNENIVSRSQAKRLLRRFDEFRNVYLDFKGIDRVGPAFIDEIYRVYRKRNPQVKLSYVNAAKEIEGMIKHSLTQ